MNNAHTDAERAVLLERVVGIARSAGAEILEVYASQDAGASTKADDSPLTLADLRAHRVIVEALQALTPQIPVLSEESAEMLPYAERSRWRRYWLVDPLDGTKEFLSRNGEFTVNIALIEGHAPALGVVHVPVRDATYSGLPGIGAWRRRGGGEAERIHVRQHASSPVRVVGSKSHRGDSLDGFLARLGPHELVPVGSSLKFCMVAEGEADVYPRLGPTSEWDTAAAQAVVCAAGGVVVTLDGQPLSYNAKPEILNPHFVVYADRGRDWLALLQ
ncbi:MAG: 3'(2'),5'-bisphosphate nucleotidase CysQ [Steroidobacteraceae bacterium]|jgi:3'(2'), 5'-bisphosphate nucleotidase|nr:3'(2'),5'-bisphosphate nucleotidase CysQ [Steroidobacteraceae bacterium]